MGDTALSRATHLLYFKKDCLKRFTLGLFHKIIVNIKGAAHRTICNVGGNLL